VQYPHKNYILYLLSRRMTAYEVQADCVSKNLMPPNDEDLEDLAKSLGDLPKFWKPVARRGHVTFRRWLRDRGVLPLWIRDETMEKALVLLARGDLRKDFETLMTAHGDVEECRKHLLLKYTEGKVPSVPVLARFCEYFWDLSQMSYQERFDYLEASQEREDYLPALRGDLEKTYAHLGIIQKVEFEDMLQLSIALTQQQMMLDYKRGVRLSGHERAGIAAMQRTAIEAGRTLRDLHEIRAGDSTVRDRAAGWLASRVVQEDPIVSIDDLRGDVIDAEYAEADNVRRLPVRKD
jgi:hypothetical protein